jgi:hypothetical protein
LINIKSIVEAKAKTIRPATIVMFWRHCVLELFKYLSYEKL